MAVETLTCIPSIIEAGSTIRFTENFPGFAPATWTAKLFLGFDTPWQVEATTSGNAHLFEISALNSAGFPSGMVPYTAYVYDVGGERTIARQGVIRVMPNAAAVREPSQAELLLAQIELCLNELLLDPDKVVDFNGQSRTSADRAELDKVRMGLQAEVLSEQRERLMLAGGADPNIINVRYA